MGNKNIPLYIFNEHNKAFFFWIKAKYSGFLNNSPIDLFHLDAHADMGAPTKFKSSLYYNDSSLDNTLSYYKNFAKTELSISNFIYPAILLGLINNVYCIFPNWRQFKAQRRAYTICSVFGDGINLKYGTPSKEDKNPLRERAFPDKKKFNFFTRNADAIPNNRRVILDIDLDFFSCDDYPANSYEYIMEISKKQFLNKETISNDPTLPFSGIQFFFFSENAKYFVKVKRKTNKSFSYIPDESTLTNDVEQLTQKLILKKVRPICITISRSCISGYCPPDKAEYLEKLVVGKLKEAYPISINE